MTNDDPFARNGQDRKLAFVHGPIDRPTTSMARITKPASRLLSSRPARLSLGPSSPYTSDLPGRIAAQVTQNVYDIPTERFLLIPRLRG